MRALFVTKTLAWIWLYLSTLSCSLVRTCVGKQLRVFVLSLVGDLFPRYFIAYVASLLGRWDTAPWMCLSFSFWSRGFDKIKISFILILIHSNSLVAALLAQQAVSFNQKYLDPTNLGVNNRGSEELKPEHLSPWTKKLWAPPTWIILEKNSSWRDKLSQLLLLSLLPLMPLCNCITATDVTNTPATIVYPPVIIRHNSRAYQRCQSSLLSKMHC